ncbi:cell division protein FtsZ [Candidatus Dependentiae bacterium]|nr:cell division protein FtsZ [Candidatus Dependentiae bacterium]
MIELNIEDEQRKLGASLRVIGIGGGGGNAVNSMINGGELEGVEFIVANTDAQALDHSPAESKVQLGAKITKGLGAGSNPDVGRRAAEEDLDSVMHNIADSDILFLTAGLGGGTGSGGLPVIAQAAREAGILSVAVVTKPFQFEGRKRMSQAEEAIEQLQKVVDTLIIVPNQKLLEVADPNISMLDAFAMSNDILMQGIKGIADIITKPGHINVDFADVRSVMKGMGMAIMGTGQASGEHRAKEAVMKAINSPLLENVSIEGARGVLINITGNSDLGLHEIHEAVSVVYELVSRDANIILGSVVDPNIGDDIMVTVIATGFESEAHSDVSDQQEAERVIAASQYKQRETEARRFLLGREDEQVQGVLQTFDLEDVDTPAFLRKNAHKEDENISQQ